MRAGAVLVATSLAVSACVAAAGQKRLPDHAYIVEPSEIASLFSQCSRYAPEFAPTGYQLRAEDIVALERALPGELPKHRGYDGYGSGRVRFEPSQYMRHYAAYEADGRAMIYGSFAPLSIGSGRDGPTSPPMICDGGPSFFGVEYDVARGQITRISFNGLT